MRLGLAALAMVAALGCGVTDLVGARRGPADGGSERADAGADAHDAGRDAGMPDTGPCVHWELEPWPVDSVSMLSVLRQGTTERLEVVLTVRDGCESPVGVERTLSPGGATDFVSLTAWVLASNEGCGARRQVRLLAPIAGREQGNPNVSVTVTEVGLMMRYQRPPCPGGEECRCEPGSPAGTGAEGSTCLTDCSCGPGLSCLLWKSPAGAAWQCARPCSSAAECACRKEAPGAPPWTCGDGPACAVDGDCPDGFLCDRNQAPAASVDRRVEPPSKACSCDRDCPSGSHCLAGSCEYPCVADADCPRLGMLCRQQSCRFIGP